MQRVVANLAASWRRRTKRVFLVADPPQATVPFPDVPDPGLTKALGILTPRQRVAVVLRFYLDWSVAQTAEAMGNRPGTVRALTAQGIGRLRHAIKEREVSGETRG